MKPKHERTREIQKSLETRARSPIAYFDSREYVQHNLGLADGLGPVLALMDALPADRTRVEAVRSFEDGDFSVAHLDYVLGDWGPMIGFEIHRWRDDRIVEHWDNLQATPAHPNASGRTMIDGATVVRDLDRTQINKDVVATFARALVDGGDARAALAGDLVQHDPACGDGADAFLRLVAETRRYDRIHLLLGQGDFVLVVAEGAFGRDGSREPAAFYDLYRVAEGRIVEHWDVVEVIPPRETWKNANGKF